MVTHVCFAAILIGASVRPAADASFPKDQEVLLSTDHALSDVDQLGVVMALPGTGQGDPWIDAPKLKARLVEKLSAAGIKPVTNETGSTPKLVVRVESGAVPDSDKHVCRVQVSLIRLVTLAGRAAVPIPAEVWQGKPAMIVVAKAEAAEAIAAAALIQTEAFVVAHKAARNSPASTQDAGQRPATGQTQSSPQDLQAGSPFPFISSKSSQVFHRPDCRWAQNIAGGNLVGYNSRDQAVQAGKRPCKSCQP